MSSGHERKGTRDFCRDRDRRAAELKDAGMSMREIGLTLCMSKQAAANAARRHVERVWQHAEAAE